MKENVTGYRKGVTDRLLILEGETKGIKEELSRLFGRFDEFTSQINEWRQRQGRLNWPVLVTFLGVLVASMAFGFTVLISALGLFWFVIAGQINSQVVPLKNEQAAVTGQTTTNTQIINNTLIPNLTRAMAENSASVQAERDLNDRINRVSADLGQLKTRVTKQGQGLQEIETQFSSNDQTRNIQFSDQQRTNAMMWNALHDQGVKLPIYPGGPFFHPSISRRSGPPEDDGTDGTPQ